MACYIAHAVWQTHTFLIGTAQRMSAALERRQDRLQVAWCALQQEAMILIGDQSPRAAYLSSNTTQPPL